MIRRRFIEAIMTAVLAACATAMACAQDTGKATAPDNFVRLRAGAGGAYYVDATLKKRYDELFAKVQVLQADVQHARISEADARQRIDEVRQEIEKTLAEIEKNQVFVAPAKAHTQQKSETFKLGPAGVLLVKAQRAEIVGWDKPHVEVVLDKIVLSVDDAPATAELDAIRAVHRETTAAEAIGRPSKQDRAKALQELTPELLEQRRALFLSMYRWYARLDPELLATLPPGVADPLRPDPKAPPLVRLAERVPFENVLDEKVDVVELDGISYESGNRNISLETKNNLGGTFSSAWRRQARLKVFVPKCKLVGIYGGDSGMLVRSVDGSVELQMQDVPTINEAFLVESIAGSLIARDVPLEKVENVAGDVDVIHTSDVGITSGPHFDDVKGQVTARREKTSTYHRIGGRLRGWFVQSKLDIESVGQEVDIRNDFGDTAWTLAEAQAEATYRIVADSGAIQLRLADAEVLKLPLTALTEVGDVIVPSDLKQVDSFSFSTPGEHDARHSWHGFVTTSKSRDPMAGWDKMQRVHSILSDAPRAAGIDLVTRAGSIRVLIVRPEKE